MAAVHVVVFAVALRVEAAALCAVLIIIVVVPVVVAMDGPPRF